MDLLVFCYARKERTRETGTRLVVVCARNRDALVVVCGYKLIASRFHSPSGLPKPHAPTVNKGGYESSLN